MQSDSRATLRARRGGGSLAGDLAGRFGLVFLLAIMFAAFALALPDTFPTQSNIFGMLGTQAVLGILAMAVITPLIAGEFDLSVGSMLGFGSIMSAYLIGSVGIEPWQAILVVLAIGVGVGLVNAFFVVVVGLSAFIATLGTATVLGGLGLYVSGGKVLFEGLTKDFLTIGQGDLWGVPYPFLYLVGLTVLMWYLLEHTPFGRLLTAVGLGRSAARLAGVRTRGLITSAFVTSGVLAAGAGIVNAAEIGSAAPTAGPEFLLPAFAAAFIGATCVKRGEFNAIGTFVGVYFLAVGIVGLQQLGLPFWFSPIFNGAALLVAVSLTYTVTRRRGLRDGAGA